MTTTVGSFPQAALPDEGAHQFAAGKLSESELTELTEQATREVIELQEDLGLDILVHGEMERGDMVAYFAEHFPGMEIGGLVRSYGNRYYHKPVITEAVRWEKPDDARHGGSTRSPSPTSRLRACLPAPTRWSSGPSTSTIPLAATPCWRWPRSSTREAQALEDAGAEVHPDRRACRFDAHGGPADLLEAMAVVTDGLKAKTILAHLLRRLRNASTASCSSCPVDQFDLEMANSDYDLLDKIREEGFDKEIGLGVLDVHSHACDRGRNEGGHPQGA